MDQGCGMSALRNLLIWTGGAALLAATAIDTIAVIGRQVGYSVHGAIELIQAAVLVAGAVALVAATAARTHARVRILVERLGKARPAAERISEVLAAIFFGALLTGSAWLSADLWASHEVSEVAGVPWRWMRLAANLALAAMLVLTLRELVRRREP
jgi:TRAP-type C4-dicarboxylate transport system permease small subunit